MFDHGSDGRTRSRVKRILKFAGLGMVVVGVGIQFVPVKDVGTNPSEHFALDAPPEVAAILRRACFDCHTNETRWPLYSRLAPGSWLMARDVHKGRTHLNFSEWSAVDEQERADDLETCWEQVESGEMPPWFYVFPMHPAARLSESDKARLKSYFLPNTKPTKSDRPAHLSVQK
jgi:Haem-binding domain